MATTPPTVLVTGASRGIGKAIALSLAAAGYAVALTARTVHEGDQSAISPETGKILPGSLDTTVAEIRAMGAQALPIRMDLLKREDLAHAVSHTVDNFGQLDVLVNNAVFVGPGNLSRLADTDPLHVEQRLFGNMIAPTLLTHAALQHMVPRGRGIIVNLTSAAGNNAPPAPADEGGFSLAYAASKAGLHRIADMVAVEYASRGISAYNLHPGMVATERVLQADGPTMEWVAANGVEPAVIGIAAAWLITGSKPDSDGPDPERPNGGWFEAQDIARTLGAVD